MSGKTIDPSDVEIVVGLFEDDNFAWEERGFAQ
jgi:hypothetical protein